MLQRIGMWPLVAAMAALVLAWAFAGRSFADSPWGESAARRHIGPITITLTPTEMRGDSLLVDVRLDTHSGDLARLDLQRQVRLVAAGRSHAPTEAVALGGHHSGGTLAFQVGTLPERFEIVVTGLDPAGPVALRWP